MLLTLTVTLGLGDLKQWNTMEKVRYLRKPPCQGEPRRPKLCRSNLVCPGPGPQSQFKEINLVWIWANLLNLNPLIPDKPVCSPDQKKIYGVARGEMVAVNCSVNANPGPTPDNPHTLSWQNITELQTKLREVWSWIIMAFKNILRHCAKW